jgi:periplasmic mercuric ion binding protein
MKTLKVLLFAIVTMAVGLNASAQAGSKTTGNLKTETFKVWGKCDMCKERIETAAKAQGATSANWSDKTLLLTVSFDPAKTNKEAICKKLAAVGHDTEKFKATDAVYANLPECCHYDRTK